MTERPNATHHPASGESHETPPGSETTHQYPVPALRDHLAVTTPGGWNWECPCGGTGWHRGVTPPQPVTCRYETNGVPCGLSVGFPGPQWKACDPVTREGWVIDIVTSPTGETLVYLGTTPRSRSVSTAQLVTWSQVLTVKYLNPTPPVSPQAV